MDNVCNRCLVSIPSKVEMAEEQEYLRSKQKTKAACLCESIIWS